MTAWGGKLPGSLWERLKSKLTQVGGLPGFDDVEPPRHKAGRESTMANDLSLDAAANLDRASAALKAAFGSISPDHIALLDGGISGAYPYRVDIGSRSYLIRVEGTASPLRNPYQYESMWIASEAGIAPKVHFIDSESRVAVMDFVDEKPLSDFPGGTPALAEAVGELLGRVRNTKGFPRFIDYPEMVGRLWWWVCQTGLFADGALDAASDRLAVIRRSYVWEGGLTSSHNDPVPGNILYDGSRLWCIDWESAYLNDPLVDLAITLDNFAQTPNLESLLIRSWQKNWLENLVPERLAHVRSLTRLYYAGVFLAPPLRLASRET
jgi:tRNA A-37 threonylcarbamoyl transferase component Bud32